MNLRELFQISEDLRRFVEEGSKSRFRSGDMMGGEMGDVVLL